MSKHEMKKCYTPKRPATIQDFTKNFSSGVLMPALAKTLKLNKNASIASITSKLYINGISEVNKVIPIVTWPMSLFAKIEHFLSSLLFYVIIFVAATFFFICIYWLYKLISIFKKC